MRSPPTYLQTRLQNTEKRLTNCFKKNYKHIYHTLVHTLISNSHQDETHSEELWLIPRQAQHHSDQTHGNNTNTTAQFPSFWTTFTRNEPLSTVRLTFPINYKCFNSFVTIRNYHRQAYEWTQITSFRNKTKEIWLKTAKDKWPFSQAKGTFFISRACRGLADYVLLAMCASLCIILHVLNIS